MSFLFWKSIFREKFYQSVADKDMLEMCGVAPHPAGTMSFDYRQQKFCNSDSKTLFSTFTYVTVSQTESIRSMVPLKLYH